jgi:hypothetical protein
MKFGISADFAWSIGRKFILPALLGALVGWMAAHGYNNWVGVVCAVSDALLVSVEGC